MEYAIEPVVVCLAVTLAACGPAAEQPEPAVEERQEVDVAQVRQAMQETTIRDELRKQIKQALEP